MTNECAVTLKQLIPTGSSIVMCATSKGQAHSLTHPVIHTNAINVLIDYDNKITLLKNREMKKQEGQKKRGGNWSYVTLRHRPHLPRDLLVPLIHRSNQPVDQLIE